MTKAESLKLKQANKVSVQLEFRPYYPLSFSVEVNSHFEFRPMIKIVVGLNIFDLNDRPPSESLSKTYFKAF